jgi:FkbM family methyltransferase
LRRFFRELDGSFMRNGVFVDVGAYDGVSISNSYFMESRLGWRGVCVEPLVGAVFEALQRQRQCATFNVAAFNSSGHAEFTVVPKARAYDSGGTSHMLSGISGAYDAKHVTRIIEEANNTGIDTIRVPTVLLRDILRQAGVTHVDVLSVDTENSEAQVLRGMDFAEVYVDVVVVEASYFARLVDVHDVLTTNGFELVGKMYDLVYRNVRSLGHRT